MLDLPSTAVAALSLYLLIRADGFSRRRYSLLFGVACGCGLLVKWTFPLVIALPVVHALATALAGVRVRRELDRLWNVAGAAALTVAIAGAWWVHNFVNVADAASYYGDDEGVLRGNPRVLTPESALWYAWNLLNTQLYVVPVGVLLVGVVFCVRRRELARGNLYPILMALGTYILFSAMRHKDPRYTLPMLPALAIIATSWVEYVSGRVRAWFTAAFAAYGAAAFVAVSFGISILPGEVSFALPSTPVTQTRATLLAQHGYIVGHPTREDWHQDDLFEIIGRYPQAERTFGYWGPDTIWFNRWGLEYLRLRYDAQRASIGEERFFIFRGPPSATPAGFTALRRWRLPDGGTLSLFRRAS
jgi:4-amino-4-deoxy-L-arabinose transferase-like glycosyltransferase